MSQTSSKLLYVVGNDHYFCSHRLPIAIAARAKGYQVFVATVVQDKQAVLEKEGLTVIPLKHLRRGRANPLQNMLALWEIHKVIKKVKPDICHSVAMKPVLFTAIASWFHKVPHRIYALGGLGFLFISETLRTRFMRYVVITLWKFFFQGDHQKLILQNTADRDVFLSQHVVPASTIVLIPGSGVDIELYKPQLHHNEVPVIVCAARMLWDKGIGELVEAARILKHQGLIFHLKLCGPVDWENPAHITQEQLHAWVKEGLIEWAGNCEAMADVYGHADLAVLPSYREGMPKSLQEAAACGLALVTTDVPGCRELVPKGTNGILVPAKSVEPLAAAIKFYLLNPQRRKSHGMNSRRLAEKSFSQTKVVELTLKLYNSCRAYT
ncbi:MAG: glycosyltransferase family 4 protein [Alphaproteobacteria bacterium]|nr:glycosyltransferase family 4 protein [Alphaproteobacteria bacterium]